MDGGYVVDISWEIPPVNLTELWLEKMHKVAELHWLPWCTNLASIELLDCKNVDCESLVLPDSVEFVSLVGIEGIKSLECGRSTSVVVVARCDHLESICSHKALEVNIITLMRLLNLVRVETPRHVPSLNAEYFHILKNSESQVCWEAQRDAHGRINSEWRIG